MIIEPGDARLRELMSRYQGGAYDAFEALYSELAGPVRRWLTSLTRDAARAEDLTQETFLQLHRARHTYDPAHAVMPWVMAIARHVYLMDRRTASRRPQYVTVEDVTVEVPPDASRGPDVERHMDGAPVRDALRGLNRDRRQALLLHHVGGWSFREIARRLGIRETAAKLRSSRGMGQLRRALESRENKDE